MKTKVNLYSPEFHPKLRLLTLHVTLLACALILVVFSGFWLYAFNQQQQLSADLDLSEQQQRQHISLVQGLQTELANVTKDPLLLIAVEQNIQALAFKKRVLQELQVQEDLKTNSFSRLMLELADNHQSGLWLSHISLDGRDVTLEGAAIESSLVPKWINTLGTTVYFKGQEFAETRLFRTDEPHINFVIASSATSGASNHE